MGAAVVGTRAGLHDHRTPCYSCDCEVQQLRREFGTEVSSQFLNCVPKDRKQWWAPGLGCTAVPSPRHCNFKVMLYKKEERREWNRAKITSNVLMVMNG